MKKIFTLLFTVGMFAAAMAQPGTSEGVPRDRDNRPGDRRDNPPIDRRDNPSTDQRDDNRYDNDRDFVSIDFNFDRDNHFGNSRFSNERKMDMQIARINRAYDYRIQQVRNGYFMSRWEKQRKIRFLQEQRQHEIWMVYMRFSKRNHHDGRDNRNDGYDRHDRNDRNDRNDHPGRDY